MPVAIPVIAGAIAGYAAVGVGLVSTWIGSMVVGAVVGGVVGGIQSAIEGGNILEGVLYGAVGGAVGGVIGGALGAYQFGLQGSISAAETAGGGEAVSAYFGEGAVVGEGGKSVFKTAATEGGKDGALLGGSSGVKEMAVAGGLGLLKEGFSSDELPYGQTKEGFEAEIAARQKIAETQAGAAGAGSGATVSAARIAADQRMREALLNADLTREKMKADASEFEKTIAQRNMELERPIQEEYAKRQRQRDTASGLTLVRTQKEAQAQAAEAEKATQEELYA